MKRFVISIGINAKIMNNRSGIYMTLKSWDRAYNDLKGMEMEDMLAKLLQRIKSIKYNIYYNHTPIPSNSWSFKWFECHIFQREKTWDIF